jgi:hypothetical protein
VQDLRDADPLHRARPAQHFFLSALPALKRESPLDEIDAPLRIGGAFERADERSGFAHYGIVHKELPSRPDADDAGRAKNRRVELVKQ